MLTVARVTTEEALKLANINDFTLFFDSLIDVAKDTLDNTRNAASSETSRGS